MKKQIVIAVVLGVLLAASTYAQTTGFFELVKTGTPQQLQAAIDQGADVNARNSSGVTPLMAAAGNNQNPEVITTLLRAGADIEARDGVGWTPLIYAALGNKNPEVTTALLKAGANVKAKDSQGKTAFDYAQYNQRS